VDFKVSLLGSSNIGGHAVSFRQRKYIIKEGNTVGEYVERKCFLFCDFNFYEFRKKSVLQVFGYRRGRTVRSSRDFKSQIT
jgi:hypothetical protein